MTRDIDSLLAPTWAPAYFVTVSGQPVLARHPVDMRFNRDYCATWKEPFYNQRVYHPDYEFFRRSMCRMNAYDENFEAFNRMKNIYYQGKAPSAPEAFV